MMYFDDENTFIENEGNEGVRGIQFSVEFKNKAADLSASMRLGD